jgi:DNA anti-recombination protein RmuC
LLHDTIARIENQLKGNEAINTEKKQELLSLIAELKNEASALEKRFHEDAGSIASFTETSVHEATREQRNEELLSHSLDGMKLSVRQFEASHPKLVNLVNEISRALWEIGI